MARRPARPATLILGIAFVAILLVQLMLGPRAAQAQRSVEGAEPGADRLIATIPLGREGVSYRDGFVDELLLWGPAALTVAPDGTFWIADTGAARLLHYDRSGRSLGAIELRGQAVGITDIAVDKGAIYALDSSAQPATLLVLSPEGKLLSRAALPAGYQLQDGLSGIALGDEGLLVEREGGAAVARVTVDGERLTVTPAPALALGGRTLRAEPADMRRADATRGQLTLGERVIDVTVENSLGGLTVLGVAPDGAVLVELQEVALTPAIEVDVTVRRYAADGTLLGMARLPIGEQYTHVEHPLAVGPDGELYALLTRPDRVEIRQLGWRQSLERVLQPIVAKDDPVGSDSPLACRDRSAMISTASGYVNNSKYLSSTNITGSCTGRTKPRYLGSAGTYSSVSYDWGGFDTVAGFNSAMTSGSQAGDINTAGVESCSKGVDCSGFVSRTWGLTTKYGTSTLPNISYQLSSTSGLAKGDIMNKSGSHVILFNSFSGSGFYGYESTTTNSVDRVIYGYRSFSSLTGYVPRRYNNVCFSCTGSNCPQQTEN